MKGSIVPIKPEVWLLNNGRLSAVVENRRISPFATVPMSKIKGVPKN